MSERRFINSSDCWTYSTYFRRVSRLWRGSQKFRKTPRNRFARQELFGRSLWSERQMREQSYSMLSLGVEHVRRAAVVPDVKPSLAVSRRIVPADAVERKLVAAEDASFRNLVPVAADLRDQAERQVTRREVPERSLCAVEHEVAVVVDHREIEVPRRGRGEDRPFGDAERGVGVADDAAEILHSDGFEVEFRGPGLEVPTFASAIPDEAGARIGAPRVAGGEVRELVVAVLRRQQEGRHCKGLVQQRDTVVVLVVLEPGEKRGDLDRLKAIERITADAVVRGEQEARPGGVLELPPRSGFPVALRHDTVDLGGGHPQVVVPLGIEVEVEVVQQVLRFAAPGPAELVLSCRLSDPGVGRRELDGVDGLSRRHEVEPLRRRYGKGHGLRRGDDRQIEIVAVSEVEDLEMRKKVERA